jgi:hypothetical protein
MTIIQVLSSFTLVEAAYMIADRKLPEQAPDVIEDFYKKKKLLKTKLVE